MDSIVSAFSGLFGGGGGGGWGPGTTDPMFTGVPGGGSGGGGLASIISLLTSGIGLAGNLSAARARGQEESYLKNAQGSLTNLKPGQLGAMVTQETAPLNTGLVQSVGNLVQGQMGERGLAQAPGIFASTLGQGLAPFEQQNQQVALQLVLQKLGLPIQYADALAKMIPQGTNNSQLYAMLMRTLQGGQNTNTPPFNPGLEYPALGSGTDTSGGGGGGLPDWLTPPASPIPGSDSGVSA